MDTLIIGAGITGLSTGYNLRDNYLILEKENEPGGLCRSVRKGGFVFDYSGHFLHLHTDYGKKFIKNMMGGNLCEIKRKSFIYSHDTYTKYPFQVNLFGLPDETIKKCIKGFIKTYFEYTRDNKTRLSFRDWVIMNFGAGIGEEFFFPYNEKLLRFPLDKITTDWIGTFVPQPGAEDIFLGSVVDYQKKFGYNASFFYPKKGGIGSLINQLAQLVKNIKLDSGVTGINNRNKVLFAGKQKYSYKNIVSTIPLPDLLNLIEDLPGDIRRHGKKLVWNSVCCINLGIRERNIFDGKHWVYLPEKKFPFYRIGCYSNINRSMAPENCSSVYVESSQESFKKMDSRKILDKVTEALEEIGVSSEKIVESSVVRMPFAYVIYDKNRNDSVKCIQEYLRENNIYSIGRFGGWKYSYIEESILEGKETAEKIMNGNN